MSRKERLLQHLKDTKSSNNAWEFCALLNSINKLKSNKYTLSNVLIMHRLKDIIPTEILNSVTDTNTKSLKSDLIMNRLKDIIHTEEPEYNINKFILMSLKNRSHDLREVSEFISRSLLDIDHFDCGKQNSEEYLMHFIQEFERLINLYGSSLNNFYGYNLRDRDFKALEEVAFTLLHIAKSCTADLLRALRHKYQLHFFNEEKKKIGFLMVEAITPIENHLHRISGILTPCKIKSFLLLRRSSLQYLRDFFESFPVDETPLKLFDMNRIDLCIEELDRDIDIMCKNAEFWAEMEHEEDEDGNISDYEEHDDLEEDGASTMPESHVWWIKCSQTLNRIGIN
ncbi:uncharacterized protein [Parasteatoda tepidariorum]|uniref:uncharacterized protein n=1 Tax=Parasteatoda tepidariorum TaxID=114398 RepID=UPI0039BC87F8